MYVKDLRAKQDDELVDLFEDLKESLYTLRINRGTGELVDTTQFRKARRDIARVLTVLREREIAAAVVNKDK
jgi:large subunit ribosomal protein L29